MPATEVDLTDYRSFVLGKLKFLREIVLAQPMSAQFLIQHPSTNRHTSAREMNSGFAR
jgi:hypothetical protein